MLLFGRDAPMKRRPDPVWRRGVRVSHLDERLMDEGQKRRLQKTLLRGKQLFNHAVTVCALPWREWRIINGRRMQRERGMRP